MKYVLLLVTSADRNIALVRTTMNDNNNKFRSEKHSPESAGNTLHCTRPKREKSWQSAKLKSWSNQLHRFQHFLNWDWWWLPMGLNWMSTKWKYTTTTQDETIFRWGRRGNRNSVKNEDKCIHWTHPSDPHSVRQSTILASNNNIVSDNKIGINNKNKCED